MRLDWLKSTTAVLAGLVAGGVVGVYAKGLGPFLDRLGSIYISFLMMCVIPVLVSAVVTSLARLLSSHQAPKVLKRMIVAFLASMATVGLVVFLLGVALRPGAVSNEARMVFGDILVNVLFSAGADETEISLASFIYGIVPQNLFEAFVSGNNLQILFFSVVFGVILGLTPAPSKDWLVPMIELVLQVFQTAISWSMYALPFAMFCLTAGQVATLGVGVFSAMGKFVAIIAGACTGLVILSMFVIALLTGVSLRRQFQSLRPIWILGIGTRSSVTAMPMVLGVLTDDWRLDRSTVNLVVPFGMVIVRNGMVMVTALALVFIAQLYFVPVTLSMIPLIVINAIVAAVTTAGAPAVVSMGAVGVAADQLRLPHGAVLPLLVAVLPIIDPLMTVANITINCATAAFVAGRPGVEKEREGAALAPSGWEGATPAGGQPL